MDKEIGSDKKDKPALTEEAFSRLLEAAYVLQEHNRRMREMELRVEPREKESKPKDLEVNAPVAAVTAGTSQAPPAGSTAQHDYTPTLAQIVETQHKIQLKQLKLEDAMALVAERITEITRAGGAAIGIVDGGKIHYRAAAGAMALPLGTAVSIEKSLCGSCVRTGQVFRCPDVNSEFLIDPAECRRRGIESLISVPIYHEGGVAGGLELYYATTQAFAEQDVHSCQLMAGLVTEALARADELTWKQSLASERAAMLDAIEKLKPNLAALVETAAAKNAGAKKADSSVSSTHTCSKCGHHLRGEEVFCGKCGAPRPGSEPPDMESALAALWKEKEANTKKNSGAAELFGADGSDDSDHLPMEMSNFLPEGMPDLFAPAEEPTHGKGLAATERFGGPVTTQELLTGLDGDAVEEDGPSPGTAIVKTDWTSAAAARDFLQQLAGGKPGGSFEQFWRTRRGDIYLAIAVILVALVIRWAIWSDHPVGAVGNPNASAATHKKAPDADLPLLDRMLISLGLAEAPLEQESKGNPDTQVWIDLQTALYYCPGSDLYGKTPKGKFAAQRAAQLDSFEPAYRKACD